LKKETLKEAKSVSTPTKLLSRGAPSDATLLSHPACQYEQFWEKEAYTSLSRRVSHNLSQLAHFLVPRFSTRPRKKERTDPKKEYASRSSRTRFARGMSFDAMNLKPPWIRIQALNCFLETKGKIVLGKDSPSNFQPPNIGTDVISDATLSPCI
jgi:hypothetical protein